MLSSLIPVLKLTYLVYVAQDLRAGHVLEPGLVHVHYLVSQLQVLPVARRWGSCEPITLGQAKIEHIESKSVTTRAVVIEFMLIGSQCRKVIRSHEKLSFNSTRPIARATKHKIGQINNSFKGQFCQRFWGR